MSYTKMEYLLFFLPIVLVLYQFCPKKHRDKVLLLASYVFFFSISHFLIAYILAATVVTHFCAKLLGKYADAENPSGKWTPGEREKKKKLIYSVAIILLFGTLLVLKYRNFFVFNVGTVVNLLGGKVDIQPVKLLTPVGISFYTLEAVGYLLEVKWGRAKAYSSFWKTALFLCFFPKVMEGPICRCTDWDWEHAEYKDLEHENLKQGMIRIFWGLFKKFVIADRLAIQVGFIYDNYQIYHGAMIAFAAVAYTIQLYMEFSGVMDVVLGSAQLFGIVLPENFRQPFFARNATEFWQRWHITLGVWLKNYVFYPVSVSSAVKKWNQFGRKKVGRFWTKFGTSAMALFPVWLFNGLWHGPQWNYIFYGMYYFVILLIEVALESNWRKWMKKINVDMKAGWYRVGQGIRLLLIVFTGEMFFRADSMETGIAMFTSMFRDFNPAQLGGGALAHLGIDKLDIAVVSIGILIVLIVDVIREKGTITFEWLNRRPVVFRWSVYYTLILMVILFGAYGEGYRTIDLIYAGF